VGKIKIHIIVIVLFLVGFSAFSQTEINGRITATSGETLPGASVLLKDKDQKIIAFAISGNSGGYMLEASQPGDYNLEVNFLGFEKQTTLITVTTTDKTLKHDFTLKEGGEMLKEVVIEAGQPVTRKGDTLSYSAKALSTGHEVVVEDLLKNIPGITILADGTIKYGDTTVEKVMVDGDDLFNRGYSLLTKNMPTQPLDKIEVLRNYSKNKLLKGIENSDGVALNLTIDEKFRAIWFGNLTVGYGNDNRYNAKGNLMNFGKSYKNFFNFSANNAGIDNVGNINDMQYNSSDLETIGGGRASQVMNLSNSVSRIDESRARFNNAKAAGLSSIMPLGKKAKLRLRGFAGFDELSTFQNSRTVTDFEDTYFENNEVNNSKSNIKKGYLNASINYDVSATQMLQTLSTFNLGKTDFNNNLTFNGVSTREQLETNSTYFDQQLTYTHKWKNRNVVLLKGRFLTDKLPQNYGINSYLLGNLFTYDSINAVGNNIKSSKQYAGLQADFKLKQKNGNLIAFNAGFENNNDNLATQFSLFTNNGIVNPSDFQSHSSYNVADLYAKSGYAWQIGKAAIINGSVSVHQLFNRFENKEGQAKNQNPFFVNPYLNLKWDIVPGSTLFASYTYNVSNSSIQQINDAYLLTSSRSFTKGLGDFNQLESSSANVSYTKKHYLDRYSVTTGLSYARQNDVISYRSQLDQNSAISEAFVMRGGDRVGANINTYFVIKKLKGAVAFDVRADRNVYYNIVNESALRKNIVYGQNYKLGWRSSFKSAFNFNLGTEWRYSQVKSDNTFKNTSKFSFLDLMYAVTDKLDFKAKAEHYNFGGLDKYNNYFFADLEAKYSLKKDTYSISLSGRNLFNTNVFTTYSVSDVGYSTNSYRLLPRYVMLSFTFRF
jgi:hypothetical protein